MKVRLSSFAGEWKDKKKLPLLLCGLVFAASLFFLAAYAYGKARDYRAIERQQEKLLLEKNAAERSAIGENSSLGEGLEWKDSEGTFHLPTAGIATILENIAENEFTSAEPVLLPEYETLYEQNNDLAGWLSIEGTVIDYPVMQTPENENTYLYLDFYKRENKNGSLILDTDSVTGIGTAENGYARGAAPSTNLIIHGHTMKSGAMFGDLDLYAEESYGEKHSRICFDTLYEKREYGLIAAFYSQVYYTHEEVFKYYQFFQADTPEEFDNWYENIKALSLYDTGVTARFGDEFITLSCCAYHVEDGRFVVVGKRVK